MIFWERQKSLTAFYEACTKPVRDAYDLTQMQFNILMFLHNNPQFDTAGAPPHKIARFNGVKGT